MKNVRKQKCPSQFHRWHFKVAGFGWPNVQRNWNQSDIKREKRSPHIWVTGTSECLDPFVHMYTLRWPNAYWSTCYTQSHFLLGECRLWEQCSWPPFWTVNPGLRRRQEAHHPNVNSVAICCFDFIIQLGKQLFLLSIFPINYYSNKANNWNSLVYFKDMLHKTLCRLSLSNSTYLHPTIYYLQIGYKITTHNKSPHAHQTDKAKVGINSLIGCQQQTYRGYKHLSLSAYIGETKRNMIPWGLSR